MSFSAAFSSSVLSKSCWPKSPFSLLSLLFEPKLSARRHSLLFLSHAARRRFATNTSSTRTLTTGAAETTTFTSTSRTSTLLLLRSADDSLCGFAASFLSFYLLVLILSINKNWYHNSLSVASVFGRFDPPQ